MSTTNVKKILIISNCDTLSSIACTGLFNERSKFEVIGMLQTYFSIPAKIKLLKNAMQKDALYYARYMQLESFAARYCNFDKGDKSTLIKHIKGGNLPFQKTCNLSKQQITQWINSIAPDVILSIRPGHIFSDDFIQSVPPILNLHCTALPNYRGIGGVLQTLVAGEKMLGCTVHQVTSSRVDDGPIAAQSLVSTIPARSVFFHTMMLYQKAQTVIKEALQTGMLRNDLVDTDEMGSYFSWPDTKVLAQLKKSGRQLFQIKDIFENYGS